MKDSIAIHVGGLFQWLVIEIPHVMQDRGIARLECIEVAGSEGSRAKLWPKVHVGLSSATYNQIDWLAVFGKSRS